MAGLFRFKTNMKNNTEIQLSVSELKSVLPGLSKVVSKRSTLPVLGCVKLERNAEGEVSIQATDLDDYVTVRVKEAVPGQPGAFLVPYDSLTKAVKGSSKQESIVLVDGGKKGPTLRTFIGNSPVDQKLESPELVEWPSVPVIKDGGIIVNQELKQAIQEAFQWASEDESRQILQSVYLDVVDPKAHYVIGTNGRALFSANSFNLDLKTSLIIPHRKFLGWSGAWDEDACWLSHEPAIEIGKDRKPGWVQFRTDKWTFVTRQIEGNYPNWKQVVPRSDGKWTTVELSEAALKQMLQIIPRLPGDEAPNHPVRLQINTDRLLLEGRNHNDKEWTSIPVEDLTITGKGVEVALNRHYLLSALRQGLNRFQVEDSLTPLLFTKGGKRIVIMPVRLEASTPSKPSPKPSEAPKPASETTTHPAPPQPETQTNNERTDMTKTTPTATSTATDTPASDSAIKSVIQQVEKIKDTLKDIVGEFSDLLASLKQAEKEKKGTEKEIESIRATLRTIQSVKI